MPVEGFCFDPTNPLRLVQANVRYEGTELAPQTVADFLPPVLQQLNLFVPAEPTPAETDAAIRMATAVLARYGRQNTVVTVAPPVGRRARADEQPFPVLAAGIGAAVVVAAAVAIAVFLARRRRS